MLEIGGLPKGKICEIVGQPTCACSIESTSGKTTLALRFLAQAQAHGPVAYMDPARVFDAGYAHRCGIHVDLRSAEPDQSRLLVGRPNDLTECLVTAEALVRSEFLAALVIDASTLLAGTLLESETFVTGADRQLGAFLRRISAPLARSGLVLLFVHGAQGWGPLAHHAALRLGICRTQWLRQHGDVYGYRSRVEVLKSRVGPAGRAATITIDASARLVNDARSGEGL
jgi:RecA/RadA recombinase